MTQEQEQVHSQASEEAKREYVRLATELFGNLGLQADADECECVPAVLCAACEDCIGYIALTLDRVSRERTRQALERAAELAKEIGDKAHAHHEEKPAPEPREYYHWLRGRCEAGAAIEEAIRGLSDGESVASEEKEE